MRSSSRDGSPFPQDMLTNRHAVRLALLTAVILAGFALPVLFETAKFSGRAVGTYSWLWFVLLVSSCVLALANLLLLALSFTPAAVRLEQTARAVLAWLGRLGWVNLLGFGLAWVLFVVVILWQFERSMAQFLPRVFVFWMTCCVGAMFLVAWRRRLGYFWALLAAAILYGAGLKTLSYLPEVSSYPFSLGWSEASRFYYASLPFAKRFYGQAIELSPLHPSRYLLLSLPFLFERSSIWLLRFWQVFLWVAMSLATGLVFSARLSGLSWRRFWSKENRAGAGRLAAVVLSLWAFLFLLQGPVYYHLHLCLLPILLFFDRRKFARSLLVVVLASLWAGISRVNWFPVPGLLASALYFLEQPVSSFGMGADPRAWLRYLARPFAWTAAGLAAALAAQAGYVLLSGHADSSAFESTFTSALLWYRLQPSATYSLGVLPAVTLISGPLVIFLAGSWARDHQSWHPLRLLALSAILVLLLLGGLVVSTKIGGGGNAHNLDAFLALLMMVGGAVWFQEYTVEAQAVQPKPWRPWGLVFAVALLPVIWNLDIANPFLRRDFSQASSDLQKLTAIVQEYSAQGEVLFITQRQLVVFEMIPDVPLTADYELLMLSEMAISNNRPYLERFEHDLAAHRFALIISDRSLTLRDPLLHNFAEENNAWVEHIGFKLDRYYQSLEWIDTQGIDTLVPRR